MKTKGLGRCDNNLPSFLLQGVGHCSLSFSRTLERTCFSSSGDCIYIYLRCDTLNFFISSQNEKNPSQRANSTLLLSLISKCQRGIAFNKYFYTALQSNCHCVKTGLRRITHCQIPSSECKIIAQVLAEK